MKTPREIAEAVGVKNDTDILAACIRLREADFLRSQKVYMEAVALLHEVIADACEAAIREDRRQRGES